MVFIKFFFPKFAGKTTTFQTFSQKLLATQPFLHCRPFLVIALSLHLSFSGLYSVTPLRNTNICAFNMGTSSWELPPELQAQIQALHIQHLQKNYTLSLDTSSHGTPKTRNHCVQQVRSSAIIVKSPLSITCVVQVVHGPSPPKVFLPALYSQTPLPASSLYPFTCFCAQCLLDYPPRQTTAPLK